MSNDVLRRSDDLPERPRLRLRYSGRGLRQGIAPVLQGGLGATPAAPGFSGAQGECGVAKPLVLAVIFLCLIVWDEMRKAVKRLFLSEIAACRKSGIR
jgi:hypothetical protein